MYCRLSRDGVLHPGLEMVPLCYNYVLNYGLGVVGSKMAMDLGSTKWNRC